MPSRHRHGFPRGRMPSPGLRGINPAFAGLSPCGGQVAYVLRTLAPVAGICIATNPLPIDLHVLSLPLAFILSQDQTLHCIQILLAGVRRRVAPADTTLPAARLPGAPRMLYQSLQ